MSLLVCHVQKFKASDVRGIQIHNQRESNNSKNKDIDRTKTHLNYDLRNTKPINFNHRVKEILAEGYIGTKKIRTDAVLMCGVIVTAEKVFFDGLSKEEQIEFFKESYAFLAKSYGEQNIVSAIVHMDETTPHLHFSLVPLTQDGRLSGKDLFGRNELKKLQDKLPQHLSKRFEIERGRQGSNNKHTTSYEFKLEASVEYYKAKLLVLEQKIQMFNKVCEKNPELKKIFDQQFELENNNE